MKRTRTSLSICLLQRDSLAVLFVVLTFVGLYWPMVGNGWLGLDDEILIHRNPHLGHGLASFLWGWGDVDFGRRWTPVLWSVASLVGAPSAFRFHILVFALGLGVVWLVTSECVAQGGAVAGGLAALWFVVSPLRCEVFGWEMGFVYGSVALLLCLSYRYRARATTSVALAAGALLCYPIAAGGCLLCAWRNRARWQGWALAALVVALAVLQLLLRRHMGFVPWKPRFDALPLVVPHYALVTLWPVAGLPLFPALFYPYLPLGVALAVVVFLNRPAKALAWLVLLAPVMLASVTESFWFGGRYALVPCAWVAVWMAGEFRARANDRGFVALAVVAVVLAGGLNLTERWMWAGAAQIGDGVFEESRMVGREFRIEFRASRKALDEYEFRLLGR